MKTTAPQPKPTLRPAARMGDNSGTSRRGFASLTSAQRQRIASAGGKASHASGKGHRWTSEEARAAGKIGGRVSPRGAGKK